MTQREQLIADLDDMEQILIHLDTTTDIWQNRVIKALARAIYHILVYLVRKDSQKNQSL